MGQPNWAALYRQGRCKAFGVPWNENEAIAVFKLGIPAAYVRRGATTLDKYEELKAKDEKVEKATGEKPLAAMNREELGAEANKAGVEFSGETPDDSLAALIQLKRAENAGTIDSAPALKEDAPKTEEPSSKAAPKKRASKKSAKATK